MAGSAAEADAQVGRMMRWLAGDDWVEGRLYVSHVLVAGRRLPSSVSMGVYQPSLQDWGAL